MQTRWSGNRLSLSHALCTTTANGEVVVVRRLRGGKLQIRKSERGGTKLVPKQHRKIVAEIQQLTRRLSISYVDPLSLKPNPKNARSHTDRHVSQLAASLREFDFLVPILIDKSLNVIAGHGRLAAALKLALSEVPVVFVTHLSTAQKRAYALADNRLAELSEWDPEILRIELAELSVLELPFEFEVTCPTIGKL